MKSKIVIICGFLLASVSSFAQKLTECKIVYEVSSDLWKDKGAKEWITYVKGDKARIETNMMEGMESVVLVDGKKKEVTTLTKAGENKVAYVFTTADMKKYNTSGEPTVTITKETKVIAGYTCKKAEITSKEGVKVICYFTDQLGAIGITELSNPIFKDIKGMMLEYSINQQGMNIHSIAKKVTKEKVDDAKFTVPAGYKVMKAEELMKSMGH
jgi:hypothetical protein